MLLTSTEDAVLPSPFWDILEDDDVAGAGGGSGLPLFHIALVLAREDDSDDADVVESSRMSWWRRLAVDVSHGHLVVVE